MAVLIEHTAGAFPLWLAPQQVVVIPIAERHHDYARSVCDQLRAESFRVKVDERNEKMGYKIREAQLKKIPFMLVVGDREMEESAVSVRNRKDGDQGQEPLSEFIPKLRQLVEQKALTP